MGKDKGGGGIYLTKLSQMKSAQTHLNVLSLLSKTQNWQLKELAVTQAIHNSSAPQIVCPGCIISLTWFIQAHLNVMFPTVLGFLHVYTHLGRY